MLIVHSFLLLLSPILHVSWNRHLLLELIATKLEMSKRLLHLQRLMLLVLHLLVMLSIHLTIHIVLPIPSSIGMMVLLVAIPLAMLLLRHPSSLNIQILGKGSLPVDHHIILPPWHVIVVGSIEKLGEGTDKIQKLLMLICKS